MAPFFTLDWHFVGRKQTRSICESQERLSPAVGVTPVGSEPTSAVRFWVLQKNFHSPRIPWLCIQQEPRARGYNTSDSNASVPLKDSVKDALTITVKVLKESIRGALRMTPCPPEWERETQIILLFNYSTTLFLRRSFYFLKRTKEAAGMRITRTQWRKLEHHVGFRDVCWARATWKTMTDFLAGTKTSKHQCSSSRSSIFIQ